MTDQPVVKRDHMLSNGAYDVLKFIAQILLPAAGTLYFALAGIWSLPVAEEVIGTITAVDAFLGVLLGLSTSSYDKSTAKYQGIINVVTKPEGGKLYDMVYNGDPDLLDQEKQALFKIQSK